MMELKLNELSGEAILKEVYNKELNSKKSILEAIEIVKSLVKEGLDSDKIQVYEVVRHPRCRCTTLPCIYIDGKLVE